MKSKGKSYRERLSVSPEEKEDAEKELDIEDAEEQLKSDIRATKRAIISQERTVEGLKNARPLNLTKLYEEQSKLNNLKNGLKVAKELKAELFPSKDKPVPTITV